MKLFNIFFIFFLSLLLIECDDNPVNQVNPESSATILAKGGNGNGNGSGNGSTGGGGQDFGDLIICLRYPTGIPYYVERIGPGDEPTPFPLPIKFDEVTLLPVKEEGVYATFDLNEIGEVIPETGYIVKEVEFGRLNLVRAPQSVLDQALQEAITSLTQQSVTDIKIDASGRLVAINGAEDWLVNIDENPGNDEEDDKTIDAPRENMAIYQELMTYGFTNQLGFLATYFPNAGDVLKLAVGAAAAGADKTGNMNVDEIAYMNDWILDWDYITNELGPDDKDRRYFDFGNMQYSRGATYATKYVEITTLDPDGTWVTEIVSLLNAVTWTNPQKLIDYSSGANTNITGFANAVDDAIQVLEFIHSSDLIVYNPYFAP